nr:MAG TPA: hypothetical protein [Caudoviricetes sp.]
MKANIIQYFPLVFMIISSNKKVNISFPFIILFLYG